MYGYSFDGNSRCSPKTFIKVVSLMMSAKYMEPFINFRKILCNLWENSGFLLQIKAIHLS
jgi:hypothetical protein